MAAKVTSHESRRVAGSGLVRVQVRLKSLARRAAENLGSTLPVPLTMPDIIRPAPAMPVTLSQPGNPIPKLIQNVNLSEKCHGNGVICYLP